jgi:signal peptidase II
VNTKNIGFSVTVAVGLVLDQLSKAWARSEPLLQTRDGWAVSENFLHLVRRENSGAAFSLLSGLPAEWRVLAFALFNVVAAGIGLWLLSRTTKTRWARAVGIGLFVAGAVGNGIDRLVFGSVTDFIRVHADVEPLYSFILRTFGRADGPVFNIADIWLLLGVLCIVILDWRWDRRPSAVESSNAPTV